MAKPVCELCGGSDFVKDEGVFVCQGCGTKYTAEEARRLMADGPGEQAPQQPQPPQPPQGQWQAPAMQTGADFSAQAVNVGAAGARAVNNYICQAWQLIIGEYNALDHPGKEQHDILVTRAKECLSLLNSAAMLEPGNDPQCLLIYTNCCELEESVTDAEYWEKAEDGSWKSHSLGFFGDVDLPGQDESWESRRDRYHDAIAQAYMRTRPDLVERKGKLQAEIAQVQQQLDALKDEKRSHGLFDFKGRGEVKDRMRPVKDQLRGLESQVRDIDEAAGEFADQQLERISGAYVRLDF